MLAGRFSDFPEMNTLSLIATALLGFVVCLHAAEPKDDSPRRISILFFGAPTSNGPAHAPITRYRILKKRLGSEGIDLTYSEEPRTVFSPETLAQYDGLMMYGNWERNDKMPADEEKALLDYVNDGGAFLPIHCASACYGASENFVKLVGAKFKSHETGVFSPQTILPDHPIMKGYGDFTAWDETYIHSDQTDDRTILQTRDKEPWTWVRNQGKGRVFYTASGHDHRVWNQPEFADLLRRAILWSVGDEVQSKFIRLKLPHPKLIDVQLPGYRDQKLVTKLPEPLSPSESMKLAQVPTGFELSLFAADPDIVNPIFITWDEKGRAWVIETIDYPNNLQAHNLGHDRITICEDTDGDGKADKFTRFAEKLSIPSTLAFINGGVVCTNGSEVLFLKDTDGDDKADIRVPLFNGLRTGDTHAGVSNFRRGSDNWIYATTGYSGIGGTIGNKPYDFSQALFRFKIDFPEKIAAGADGTMQEHVTLEVLQITTNNTWGLGFTNEFDIMGSTANANPSWYYTFAKNIYESAGLTQPLTPRADNNPFFNPSTMDIRQVDQFDRFTAAAGHAFYTGSRFPEGYRDKVAFICGPTGKLVANFNIDKKDSGFIATQSPNNLYNSADAWSAPVCAEVGPDGAVWICDWYNLIVQHNPTPTKADSGLDAKSGPGNAYMTPLRDKEHGRIYRVFPKGSKNQPKPASLTAAISSPDFFWRITAQRLIVDSSDQSQAPALKNLVTQADAPVAISAFGTLQGLGLLDPETIRSALKSASPALRRMALSFAPMDNTMLDIFIKDGKIIETDPRTLMELYLALARHAPSDAIATALIANLGKDADKAILDAWQVAARKNSAAILAKVSPEKDDKLADAPNLPPNPNNAAIASLKSYTPNASAVEAARKFPIDPVTHARGKTVFGLTCIACHGPDGNGVEGAFPPINGSDWLTGDPAIPAKIIMHGLQGSVEINGKKINSVMPPLVDLNDQQIADVLTYVRQSWKNDAQSVTLDQVKEARAASASQPGMFKPEDLRK